jgi:hypothetical protein
VDRLHTKIYLPGMPHNLEEVLVSNKSYLMGIRKGD